MKTWTLDELLTEAFAGLEPGDGVSVRFGVRDMVRALVTEAMALPSDSVVAVLAPDDAAALRAVLARHARTATDPAERAALARILEALT